MKKEHSQTTNLLTLDLNRLVIITLICILCTNCGGFSIRKSATIDKSLKPKFYVNTMHITPKELESGMTFGRQIGECGTGFYSGMFLMIPYIWPAFNTCESDGFYVRYYYHKKPIKISLKYNNQIYQSDGKFYNDSGKGFNQHPHHYNMIKFNIKIKELKNAKDLALIINDQDNNYITNVPLKWRFSLGQRWAASI